MLTDLLPLNFRLNCHSLKCDFVLSYLAPLKNRFHKWRPINYSFVYVLIRPTSLVRREHFLCILSVLTRLVGLISTKKIGYFFGRPLCNRSIAIVDFSNAYGIGRMMLLANKPF